ncbi:MAG: hypothetical protein RLZZ01_1974 [Actinomycetota bacterium]|jgi:uncharacterized membrane protein YebE (DUF533 family)
MSTKTAGHGPTERVTADDLQRTLQSFQDTIQGTVDDQKSRLVAVGGGALVVLLVLFFLLGRRNGRKKSTLVEIRRF